MVAKKSKPFWITNTNPINGYKKLKVKKTKSCVQSQSLRQYIVNVFKPKGFR